MNAKGFLKSKGYVENATFPFEGISKVMVEFAEFHVKKALDEVVENARVELDKDWIRKEETIHPNSLVASINIKVNKDSILNAYPLNNIK